MPQIQLLSDDLINKIAAGEVIERPASVVRELIENSIDADATDIRIEIMDAGKRVIRVSDNGSGMERDDLVLSFERHATSKIATSDDLFEIKTMGFRGEALSSIASVSRMRIRSVKAGNPLGNIVDIEGGVLRSINGCAAVGTMVEVNDLFYNTPARKKFLKRDSTEIYQIMDTITQIALTNHERQFIVSNQGTVSMRLPIAIEPLERISQIEGADFIKGLERFRIEDGRLSVVGYVSKDGSFKRSRSHQYIFVNRRPIRETTLRHAVYKGYGGILRDGYHPVFYLYIDEDPKEIDFNVHPAKLEVRFKDRDRIFRAILTGVRDTIGCSRIPDALPMTQQAPLRPALEQPVKPIEKKLDEPRQLSYRIVPPRSQREYLYIGDVYVAYHEADGICILDHHAAHERILYERIREGIGLELYSLLFPQQIRLSSRDYRIILTHIDKNFGMAIEDFGDNTLIIRALPKDLTSADIAAILTEIAASIVDITANHPLDEIKDIIAKKTACHSSVRGRRILTHMELNQLLSDLDKTSDPNHCPHGRPTRIYISKDKLDKSFKRII